MSAFDITGPSTIGRGLEKLAKQSRDSSATSEERNRAIEGWKISKRSRPARTLKKFDREKNERI